MRAPGAVELDRPAAQPHRETDAAVNVTDQRRDPASLLVWFERMLHTLRECPEVGAGRHTPMTVGPAHVLVHQVSHGSGALLLLHNLGRTPARVDVRTQVEVDGPVLELFGDQDYGEPDLAALELAPYGYRWIRLRGGAGRP